MGKVGLRLNILPLLSSANRGTQCALLQLGLSSCFSCPLFISKPTSFSCSSFLRAGCSKYFRLAQWRQCHYFTPLTKNKELLVMTLETKLSVLLRTVLG